MSQNKNRVVYVEPNNIPAEYYNRGGSTTNNSDNLAWKPEELSYAVDLQVIIPSRDVCGDAKDDTLIINLSEHETNYTSFMAGSAQDPRNPDSNFLTDSYTDISYQEIRNNNAGIREALGIQSIDVTFDSYFFPKVTIKMIDVRGAALMTPSEETFREQLQKRESTIEHFFNAVFHFPSPRFVLSVKGFYGTRVTFMLSYLSFGANFNAQTGNFEVTLEFIGHMYGLYSDIPFNYILIAPYIGSKDGSTCEYWKSGIRNRRFRYSDGTPIKTFIEYVHDFEKMDERYSEIYNQYGLISGFEKIRDNEAYLSRAQELYNAIYEGFEKEFDANYEKDGQNIRIYTKDGNSITIDKDSGILKDYLDFYEEFKKSSSYSSYSDILKNDVEGWPEVYQYNEMATSNSEEHPESEGYKYAEYKIETDLKKLSRNLRRLQEDRNKTASSFSSSTETIEFSGKVLNGFIPSIENTYRMVFAHLDTFMGQFYSMLDEIKNNPKRKNLSNYNIKIDRTDIGEKRYPENCFLPPFTAFFGNSIRERLYPTLYNSSLSDLEEVKFVESIFKGVVGANYQINYREKVAGESEGGGFVTSSLGDSSTIRDDLNPISILDIYTIENPYRNVTIRDGKLDEDSLCEILAIYMARVSAAAWVNEIDYSKIRKNELKNILLQLQDKFNNNEELVKTLEKYAEIFSSSPTNSKAIKSENKSKVKELYKKMEEKAEAKNGKLTFAEVSGIIYGYTDKNHMVFGKEMYVENKTSCIVPDVDGKLFSKFEKEMPEYVRYFYGRLKDSTVVISLNGPFAKSSITTTKETGAELMEKAGLPNSKFLKSKKNNEIEALEITGKKPQQTFFNNLYSAYREGKTINLSDYEVICTNEVIFNNTGRKITSVSFGSGTTEFEQKRSALWHLGGMMYASKPYGFSDCGYFISSEEKEKPKVTTKLISEILLMPKALVLYLGGLSWYYKEVYKNERGELGYIKSDKFGNFATIEEGTKANRKNEINYYINVDEILPSYWGNFATKLRDEKILSDNSAMESIRQYFENWVKTDFASFHSSYVSGGKSDKYVLMPIEDGIRAGQEYYGDNSIKIYSSEGNNQTTFMNYYSELVPVIKINRIKDNYLINITECGEFLKYAANYAKTAQSIENAGSTSTNSTTDDGTAGTSSTEGSTSVSSAPYVKAETNGDNEKKAAIYYTLKTIYDKWIPTYSRNRFLLNTFEEDKEIIRHREFGDENDNGEWISKINEYNSFVYKDTFYRNIGDRFMINPRQLYDDIKVHYGKGGNASLLQFISATATNNKLLFLPLPVLTEIYNVESMRNIFIPHSIYSNANYVNSRGFGTTYVIMYSHEPSKNLNLPLYDGDIGMENDGLDIADINGNILPSNGEVDSYDNDYNIPAFGVTYAKQNQMYFKNISVNTQENRVTDYAIMNTLMLANEEGNGDLNAPKTKGQNLYPIFANRVYDCTVEMLGCMNIMPMMLFQLNNIPLFRGAYRITNVSHHIEPGSMTTKFIGTRISKNLIPFNYNVIDIEALSDRVRYKSEFGNNTNYGYVNGATISPLEADKWKGMSDEEKMIACGIPKKTYGYDSFIKKRDRNGKVIEAGPEHHIAYNDGLLAKVTVKTHGSINGKDHASFSVNKALVNVVNAIFEEIYTNYPWFKIYDIGGYRPYNSITTTDGHPSYHVWGWAIDINPHTTGRIEGHPPRIDEKGKAHSGGACPWFDTGSEKYYSGNGLGMPDKLAEGADPPYKKFKKEKEIDPYYNSREEGGHGYQPSECIWAWEHPVVQTFLKYGWGWGGTYGDVMHFSLHTRDLKNGHIEGN